MRTRYLAPMLAFFFIGLALTPPTPSWTLLDSGVTTSIRGISAVDARTCWIGTKDGVARTTDGGTTWQFTAIGGDGDDLDFRDLHAFDAKRCVAMSAGTGSASRLYRTEDGGRTWQLVCQNTEPEGFFDGIAFRDGKNGILAGDPVGGRLFLMATDDGGASWQRIAARTAPAMGTEEHAFAASGTHLAAGGDGQVWVTSGGSVARVFRSEDWGRTWATVDTPMIAGASSTGIFSIAFRGTKGVAVGGDYEKESEGGNNAMSSGDSGKTWRLIPGKDGAPPFPFRSCVGYVDAETLVAVGPSGSDVSRDGGKTWTPIPGSAGFHTLSIAGDTVWAAGSDGRVGRIAVDSGR